MKISKRKNYAKLEIIGVILWAESYLDGCKFQHFRKYKLGKIYLFKETINA